MKKPNPGPQGQNGSQPRWEIIHLHRLSIDPAVWRGTTAEGKSLHLCYRHGVLRVEVAEPSQQHPGSWSWREVLVLRPDHLELEIDLLRRRQNPLALAADSIVTRRHEQRLIADWITLSECKADRRKATPRMNFWRLRALLQAREEHLPYLLRHGVAGAPVHLTIKAFLEG